MKKTNYFIIALLSIFMLITQVNAEQKSIIIEGSADDYANDTVLTENGNFVVVGEFSSKDITGLTNNGNYDGFIVKYDEFGEQQWIKNYGGSEDDSFYDVIATEDDGFIAVGYTCSTNIADLTLIGNCDGIAVKYDKDGNVEWQKTYGTTNDDKINVISKAQDGSYLIAGAVNYSVYEFEIRCDGYVVKIDDKGRIIFERKVATEDITLILEKKNGGYYIGDYTQQSQFYSFDKDFQFEWDTPTSIYTYVNDAVLLENDNVVIVGTTSQQTDIRIAYITKYDQEGNVIWTKNYGSDHETFNSIKIDEEGNYVVTGGKKVTKDNESISTAFLIKYDDEGNKVSEETYESEKATWYYGMDYISKNGYVYVGSTYTSGESLKDDILIVFNTEDFIYNIKTIVEGKGKIEVVDKSKAGKEVTFTITPEEGYVLNKVIVTDEFGNTVTFTDYTFTMPSADVTIEVKFDKIEESKNPDTADIFVIYFVITALVSTILLLSSKKKLNWMK